MTVDENSRTICTRPAPEPPGWYRAAAWACIYAAVGMIAFLLLYHYWVWVVGFIIIAGSSAKGKSAAPSYPGRYRIKVW